MKIVAISGHAQHGKDTTAAILKDTLEQNGHRVLVAHFGDLVKYICTTFFAWDGKKDEKGRSLLQKIGTDVIRTRDCDFWMRFIRNVVEFFPDEWDYVIIPDARFPNEIEGLRAHALDVIHLRVNRPGFDNGLTEEQRNHPSETALDHYKPDWLICNYGTFDDLAVQVDIFMHQLERKR